ncbi:MAG TPA: 2-phospho-L-lactate guanylyltransferase [Candidatus Limnocylindrales bacterium]|nr:2-phospho-L-lactate guanylyltransferase [Candidatus Limnocylindrales bacterium]
MPAAADLSAIHVVLPIRSLSGGKLRLGAAVDAEERAALIVGMLRQTLAVLAAWPPAAAVHVVSPDPDVAAVALAAGARPLRQLDGRLNAAIRAARDVAQAEGATALLILPGDLPLLDAAALDRFHEAADAALAAGRGRPIVTLAAADAGDGTNALLCSPPATIEPSFGPHSLDRHLRAAREAGASIQVVVDPTLGFDLDTPADLERLDPHRVTALEALGAEASPA